MPKGSEGILSAQEYLDIIAYVLHFNGYPAGKQDLKADIPALAKIFIEPRPAAK